MNNETLSVAAVRVCNKDCLPVGIDRRDTAPTPSGFAKSVCSADACHYSQTTRAVSSVVERLVYTERVGGSKPSPPRFPIADLRFAIDTSGEHMSDGGFDMDLCCVEKWDAVVNRIAKN